MNMLQFSVESFETAIDVAEIIKPVLDELYNGLTAVQLYFTGANPDTYFMWKDEETGIEDFYEWIEFRNDVL